MIGADAPESAAASAQRSHENADRSTGMAKRLIPHRRNAQSPIGYPEARMSVVWCLRLGFVAFILAGWQFVPEIPGIRNTLVFEDPFFISSPQLIAHELVDLVTGAEGAVPIWPALFRTVLTAIIGATAASACGAVVGTAVSSLPLLERVIRPYIVVLNAIPRVALIPVIVLIVGSSNTSDALSAFAVVFFLAFYNAAEGAGTVAIEIVQSAHLMGASKFRIMWRVRWPSALAWTFAILPSAVAFGLTGTITGEIFTGSAGLGYQLVIGIDNSNATLIFSVVFIVAVVGVLLVLASSGLRRVLLPWRESER